MTKIKEQAHFKGIPRKAVLRAIESISEGLMEDARYKYGKEAGFESEIDVNEKEGIVETKVKIFPYEYNFRWLFSDEDEGFLVTLVGRTGGKWYEFLLPAAKNLRGLMDTQWSALLNFGIGFLFGSSFTEGEEKKQLKKAKKKVKKKKKEEHKKVKEEKD